jgi:hypothetical protein
MIPVPMPEIRTTLGGKPLVVEGGWNAEVPEVTADARDLAKLTTYFQASGMLPMKAEERAKWTVQQALVTAYKKHHAEAVRRYAQLYARRYPHLWDRETGALRGFDAASMAVSCQPWEQVTQARKRIVRLRMEEMARAANEEMQHA